MAAGPQHCRKNFGTFGDKIGQCQLDTKRICSTKRPHYEDVRLVSGAAEGVLTSIDVVDSRSFTQCCEKCYATSGCNYFVFKGPDRTGKTAQGHNQCALQRNLYRRPGLFSDRLCPVGYVAFVNIEEGDGSKINQLGTGPCLGPDTTTIFRKWKKNAFEKKLSGDGLVMHYDGHYTKDDIAMHIPGEVVTFEDFH